MRKKSTKQFTYLALFIMIIIIMSITPLGYLNLGLIKATLLQIPVIVGSIILGPKYGLILGFTFGLTSFVNNTLTPSVLSFAFSPLIPVLGTQKGSLYALVIAFGPRMLIGYLPAKIIERKTNVNQKTLGITALMMSLLHTLLVMGLIFILFKDAYALANNINTNQVASVIASIILMNGIPEALISMLLTPLIINTFKRINKQI